VSLPRRPLARSWWLVVFAVVLTPPAVWAQTQRMPTLPLTQLDERGASADLDSRAFTLTFAQPVPIKDLLLLIVRGTNLSLVPDPSISGSFIGELKNVTIRQALDSILPPLGLEYTVSSGLVRVMPRQRETRLFDINYVAAARTASSTVGKSGPEGESTVTVSTRSTADVFTDLMNGIPTLISQGGTFNLDRQAGLLQVTDFGDRLDRIANYLDAVEGRVQRQVEFETQIVAVELTDAASPGIDWRLIAAGLGNPSGGGPVAAAAPPRRGLTGLRVTDVPAFLTLLGEQGKVDTIQNARLTTLNNEPAIVRSDALTLSVTPQVAADGRVMLSLTPMLKTPALAEADTLARVASGETLVISGFTHTREVRERKNLGRVGGWFGRGTVVTQKRVELVILLTPKVL
jgi:MSHA biogenesis protein MshL